MPRLPDPIARRAAVIPLVILPVAVAGLAAGGLPQITYAWVLPFIVVVPIAAALGALALKRRGTLVPAVAIATAVLVFYVVEAIHGWPDTLTTLSGGSALTQTSTPATYLRSSRGR